MAFRSAAVTHGNSRQPSVTLPTGGGAPQNGDIALLVVVCDLNATGDFATGWPAGFTRLGAAAVTLDGQEFAWGWKPLAAADTGSYSFGTTQLSGSIQWSCSVSFFSGRDAAGPVFSTEAISNASNASPVTATANGVTAVAGDDLAWFAIPDPNAASNYVSGSAPAGMTKQLDALNGAGWTALLSATQDNVSAGATGSKAGSFTLSSGAAGWGALLARLPAASTVDNTAKPALPGEWDPQLRPEEWF